METVRKKKISTEGIMLDENNGEPLYASAAHDDNDLIHTLEAFEPSLPSLCREKKLDAR
jgi:hypothetical protein